MIGINTAVIQGAQGICFAVAANTAHFVARRAGAGRPRAARYIGISAQQTAIPRRLQVAAGLVQSTAVVITAIERDSPVQRADLMTGDIVVALDGHTVTGVDDLIRLLTGERIGKPVEIDLIHLGKRRSVTVVPEERQKPAA